MLDCRKLVPGSSMLAGSAVMLLFAISLASQPQLPARLSVSGSQTCGTCRVQRTTVVALKDDEHLSPANEGSLAVDASGRVYAQDIQTKQFFMFDPKGKWLGKVGGVGAGPGEFKAAISAKVDQFDSLWVSNPGQRRLSVFAPGSRAHARDALVQTELGTRGGDWLLLDRGQMIVSVPHASKPADRLVQVGTDGRVAKRLGADTELRVRSATLAPARDGKHFWRVRVTASSYILEKWTNSGVLIQVVDRAAKWWAQPPDESAPSRRPGAGDIRVESLREDSDGKLWVIMQLPRQSYWEGRARTSGVQESPSAVSVQPASTFYRLLDVVDPQAGKLVFSDSTKTSLYWRVTSDIAICESKEDENGFRVVVLCKLALVK